MSPPRILIVGRHPEIMARVEALLSSAGYLPVGALTDAQALAHVAAEPAAAPDALLLGGGVEPPSRAALAAAFRAAWPGRPVIEHVGGPHGLLDHVRQALAAGA